MTEDLLGVLTRFHREIVLPDLERIVEEKIAPLREEMLANFDAVFKGLERLETEYQALIAGVRRLEDGMAGLEQAVGKLALRAELSELRERVHLLEDRISELEARL